MKTVLTLFLLLSFSGLGFAQEVLFFDDFRNADSRLRKNWNTLRSDLWKSNGTYTCHAMNIDGVGTIGFAVPFDTGPDDPDKPGEIGDIGCLTNSRVEIRIDPGFIYTTTIVFRIMDYDAFFDFHKGLQTTTGDRIFLTPTIAKQDVDSGIIDMMLQVGPLSRSRYAHTEMILKPYTGQWLRYETIVNTQSDSAIIVTSRVIDPKGVPLGSVNIGLTDPKDINIILGQSYTLHCHPQNRLTATERVFEIKEISVIKR